MKFLSTAFIALAFASAAYGQATETTARYKVTFQSIWDSETHPTNFPSDPHFSGLVGATHNSDGLLWKSGETASPGIEEMAETGRKNILLQEVSGLIDKGTAQSALSGGNIAFSPGEVSLEFEISQSHPLVTLVSMLAPSPDWFVGVSALTLFENGDWVARKDINLALYDAGTDDGLRFNSANANSNPAQGIQRLTSDSKDTDFVNGRDYIGQFIFEKID